MQSVKQAYKMVTILSYSMYFGRLHSYNPNVGKPIKVP